MILDALSSFYISQIDKCVHMVAFGNFDNSANYVLGNCRVKVRKDNLLIREMNIVVRNMFG